MTIIDKPSPNFNDRAVGCVPRYLILHYTNTRDAAEAEDYFMNRVPGTGPVSAHYMVDEDGTVTRHVAEDKRAWHAGQSFWRGDTDLNSLSIGIEIVNPGDKYGYRAFPPAQMAAVAALCRAVMARHGIAAENVLAHSDIAPARKQDPGELFDWPGLAAQGIGIWPRPLKADFHAADAAWLKAALVAYGYDPAQDLSVLLMAFQRHFEPEAFAENASGTATPRTTARLRALLRAQSLPFPP